MENCISNIKLYEWKNKDKIESFWTEVHCYKNSLNEYPFLKLSKFVNNLLSFPYSNTEVELFFRVINELCHKK